MAALNSLITISKVNPPTNSLVLNQRCLYLAKILINKHPKSSNGLKITFHSSSLNKASLPSSKRRSPIFPPPHAQAERADDLQPEADDEEVEDDSAAETDEDAVDSPELYADMFDGNQSSAPDYADDYPFIKDPPGHKSGFIAIIGKPNAGKSTLLNSILGQQLSVVTPKAQTTRHRILGIWSEPEHQAVFLDTPGIIADRRDELEVRMMGAVESSVRDADALLAIIDVSKRPKAALEMIQPGEDWKGPPMAVILNETDLLQSQELDDLVKWFKENCRAESVIPISALEGSNIDVVREWVLSKLPEGPSFYPKDFVAEASERFFVSEIIRGQIFQQYREELPYQVAVEVVEFKERKKPKKSLIRAHVLVEKKRHVGMLLGAGGSAIKALSIASRLEIEEFLEREIFLDISVKVAPGWRSDSAALERLGY